MNRQEALSAIQARVKNPNLIKHLLATEAVMLALAWRPCGALLRDWASSAGHS